VACSATHTICYSESDVYTFGDNQHGQLGHAGCARQTTPRVVGAHVVVCSVCLFVCLSVCLFIDVSLLFVAAFHGYSACLITA
jgi:alpha-tubulin suppressor-like RCC1 family protein